MKNSCEPSSQISFNTPGNVADGIAGTIEKLSKGLSGLAFTGKGFINQKAFNTLFEQGLKLIIFL